MHQKLLAALRQRQAEKAGMSMAKDINAGGGRLARMNGQSSIRQAGNG